MKPLQECQLYAFVDTGYLRGRAPATIARELCDGGADLIQLRAKQSSPDEVRRLAEEILPVTSRAGVPLVINDHLSVAQAVGAQFCHLGQEDFFGAGHTRVSQLVTAAPGGDSPAANPPSCFLGGVRPSPGAAASDSSRAGLEQPAVAAPEDGRTPVLYPYPQSPASRIGIGLSSAAPEQAKRAIAAGADYLGVGPVYPTGTKPSAKPVTLEYVRWAAANIQIPWFAIGGINLRNLDDVLAAGARRICVVSAILNEDDLAVACRRFKDRLPPL
jgi:thiamine-phosphate pyrophosphorylase